MVICHKNKIVYIGVPQTGSTFLHNELSKYDDLFIDNSSLKHGRAPDAIKLGAKGYEFILFVRNHIECQKSDWGLMKRVSNLGIDHINSITIKEWKTKCLNFYKENPNSDKWIMSKLEKGVVEIQYLKIIQIATVIRLILNTKILNSPVKYYLTSLKDRCQTYLKRSIAAMACVCQ